MAAVVNIAALVCACACLALAYHGPDLPKGPFCGSVPGGQCCSHRHDDCSHLILDTVCYCDQHCNRTQDDCCPDYEEVCLGLRPTAPPEDLVLPECRAGDTKRSGCNPCTCEEYPDGRAEWRCSSEPCLMSKEVLHSVNQPGSSWRAANYSEFAAKTLREGLQYKLGTLPLSERVRRLGPIRYMKDIAYPRHFDARQAWPYFVTKVEDQRWCGSDWAVAIAAVTSDRFTIQSNGAESEVLAAQTLLSCNRRGQQGCEGGHVDVAWNFVKDFGLVHESCFPYTASASTRCPYQESSSMQQDGCAPLIAQRSERYKVGPAGRLTSEKDIMYDLMQYGPLFAIMEVHQDFFHYRSGVYRRSRSGEDRPLGLHSVRLLGWGEEAGEPYWIVANSWGEGWGEAGSFRIARGRNEAAIESFVITVLADVTESTI